MNLRVDDLHGGGALFYACPRLIDLKGSLKRTTSRRDLGVLAG